MRKTCMGSEEKIKDACIMYIHMCKTRYMMWISTHKNIHVSSAFEYVHVRRSCQTYYVNASMHNIQLENFIQNIIVYRNTYATHILCKLKYVSAQMRTFRTFIWSCRHTKQQSHENENTQKTRAQKLTPTYMANKHTHFMHKTWNTSAFTQTQNTYRKAHILQISCRHHSKGLHRYPNKSLPRCRGLHDTVHVILHW